MLKKSISVLLALVMIVSIFTNIPVSASAKETDIAETGIDNMITVYFINTKEWDNVNIYTWPNKLASWPGVTMDYVGVDKSGYDIYSKKIDLSNTGVIFNCGSSTEQTVDITENLTDNKGWYCGDMVNNKYEVKSFDYNGESEDSYLAPEDMPYIPDLIDIYFINSAEWENVYAYSWRDPYIIAEWPGKEMSFVGVDASGYNIYTIKVDSRSNGILFDNGGNGKQTVDITSNIEANAGWYVSGVESDKYTVKRFEYDGREGISYLDPEDLPNNADMITVFFINIEKWDKCYIFTLNPTTAEWPGKAMTLVGKDEDGNDIYSAQIDVDTKGIVFNNGNNGKQTVDITTDIEDYNGWYTTGLEAAGIKYEVASFNYSYDVKETDDGFKYIITKDNTVTVMGYTGTETGVTIPEKINGYDVTAIAASAFADNTEIVDVIMSDSVTSIGYRAFYNCKKLQNIRLSEGLVTLGSQAFGNCYSLDSVMIPASLLQAGGIDSNGEPSGPFFNCTALKDISFGVGVTRVCDYLFVECSGLESITIPASVKSIGNYAFAGCSKLNTVSMKDSVAIIGISAFEGCSVLADISLSKGLESVGHNAFKMCTALEEITIPSNLNNVFSTDISAATMRVFDGCTNLKNVVFANGTVTIANNILNGASSVESVHIPDGVRTISEYAFCDCDKLGSISLPDSIVTIEHHAFANCSKLTEIDLPDNLETLSYYSFLNCTGFTSVTIPKELNTVIHSSYEYAPFFGCDNLTEAEFEYGTTIVANHVFEDVASLKKVTIPDTVTQIKWATFDRCYNLESISIPDGVTSIGSRAFCGCKKLKEVRLPSHLEELGYLAFDNCSGLTEITLPKSLNQVSFNEEGVYSVFTNCENLRKIVFEDGTATIANNICEGMNTITEVTIPASVKTIAPAAFKDCTSLSTITIPAGIEVIGDNAFCNCSGLKTVYFNGAVNSIADNSFSGCSGMTVYCPKYSKEAISFINNGNSIISTDDTRSDAIFALDKNESYYIFRSGSKITVIVKYKIKDEVFDSLSGVSLKLYIPEGTELNDNILYIDNEMSDDYYISGNIINIPVEKKSARISYELELSAGFIMISYATLNYTHNGKQDYDIIDIVNEDIDVVVINADDVVSSGEVAVSGIAPANSDVDIYINNNKVSTIKANKAGDFKGVVSIPDPENDTEYCIKAVAKDKNGKDITAEKNTIYIENAPKLTDFTMDYNGGSYDLLSDTKQSLVFRLEEWHGVTPFNLEAKYENNENIGDVYFTSTRDKVSKTVKATWNESKQAYTFNGFFDENDHNYVPGKISVSYAPVNQAVSFEELNRIDYSSESYIKGTNSPIIAALAGKGKDCIEDLQSDDNKLSGIIKIVDVKSQLDFNILTDIIPAYLDPENAGQYGYEPVEDDTGVKIYMKAAENCEDKVEGEIIDFATGKLTKYLIKGENYGAASEIDNYFTFTKTLGYTDKLIKWNNKRTDINDLKKKIMTSDMSPEERANALKKLDIANKANNGAAAMLALNVVLTCAGIAIPFPINLGLAMIALNNSHIVDDALGQYAYLNGDSFMSKSAGFNWSIDPSGYVYEAVTSNRVAGANVTAWWIPYDEENEDFWTIPDESKAEIWDASEYSQINPLTTDNDGNYAWDVPEGLWKVVVEKEGYETYSTGWLPVPPPQTDVNINLMSTATPELESAVYANGEITLTFSQYMDPATMNDIVIKDYRGRSVRYTLTYSQDEKDTEGNVFAKEYQLVFDDGYEVAYEYFNVTVTDAKSYADKAITAEKEIGEKPEIIGILGDADGNGSVDILDATIIQRYLASYTVKDPETVRLCGDINGDGVDILDATLIQRYLASYTVLYDIGKPINT